MPGGPSSAGSGGVPKDAPSGGGPKDAASGGGPKDAASGGGPKDAASGGGSRKSLLLRLSPELHAALERQAATDLRSVNAQIEVLLREALARRGTRLPAVEPARRGRPPKATP